VVARHSYWPPPDRGSERLLQTVKLLARNSYIITQELPPFLRSHRRVIRDEFRSSECEACHRTKANSLFSLTRVTFKFLVVPFLAWRVGNYNPPTAEGDGHRHGQWTRGDADVQVSLATRVKIPDVKFYYLVVLIFSYNKVTGSTSFCHQHPVWTKLSQILGKAK
jgi:hypothetical protein